MALGAVVCVVLASWVAMTAVGPDSSGALVTRCGTALQRSAELEQLLGVDLPRGFRQVLLSEEEHRAIVECDEARARQQALAGALVLGGMVLGGMSILTRKRRATGVRSTEE
ncbi:hypothetical protein GCM10009854_41220 [Saccharopolyspora halophila]|uniref:Uncharacterized protein n=2 Tax=Saccharopolyspora halophila TaxID=405551 RepID=A0ABN3GRF8_9PSEU